MSMVIKLMIGAGWTATFAVIGFFALKESGKLLKIRTLLSRQWNRARENSMIPAVEPKQEFPESF